MRIAILGVGKIGEALLAGLSTSGWTDIAGTVRREERIGELRERYGVEVGTSNSDAVRGAAVVVVAVKPQDLNALLDEIAPALDGTQTVLVACGSDPDRCDRAAAAR